MYNRRVAAVCLAATLCACNRKHVVQTRQAIAASQPTAPASIPTRAEDEDLPLSRDVLPRDEATANTRLVRGDGFHYQIPRWFHRVEQPGRVAYSGEVEGFMGKAPVTMWASVEPFADDLNALVTREIAILDMLRPPEVGPVTIVVGTAVKPSYAKRATITTRDHIELRTMLVHDGRAFVFHCETPNRPHAWANVGSDCITRSTTFHVAPPPPRPQPVALPMVAPSTPGVSFVMFRVQGSARTKAELDGWLTDAAASVKPCLVSARPSSTWSVIFDLDRRGQANHSRVVDTAQAAAPSTIRTCVSRVVSGLRIDDPASDDVTVTAVFHRE